MINRFIPIFVGLLISGCASIKSPTPTTKDGLIERQFFVSISRGACELEESGRLANPEKIDETKLILNGTLSESQPDVFSCVIATQKNQIPSSQFTCAVTGFQHTDLYFFKGDPKQISRACFASKLKDGFEFKAEGISSDLCLFTCTSR